MLEGSESARGFGTLQVPADLVPPVIEGVQLLMSEVELAVKLRNADTAGIVAGDVSGEPPVVNLFGLLDDLGDVVESGPHELREPSGEGLQDVLNVAAGLSIELHEIDRVAASSLGPLCQSLLAGALLDERGPDVAKLRAEVDAEVGESPHVLARSLGGSGKLSIFLRRFSSLTSTRRSCASCVMHARVSL